MNAPRKVTNATSTANQTSIFGSMPGLAPSVQPGSTQFTMKAVQLRGVNTLAPCAYVGGPAAQYKCLESNNLIFKNKLTGGVGRKVLLYPR